MAYFVCIAIGQADFLPDNQLYIEANSIGELVAAIGGELAAFDSTFGLGGEAGQSAEPYRHAFRPPSNPDVTNYSQRLRIAHDSDMVLDVIGMNEAEFYREQSQ